LKSFLFHRLKSYVRGALLIADYFGWLDFDEDRDGDELKSMHSMELI
jgi:hypothetical protein